MVTKIYNVWHPQGTVSQQGVKMNHDEAIGLFA